MIVKAITVYVKAGRLAAYLAAQEIWNREMLRSEGYLGCFVGAAADEANVIHVHTYWRARADLDRFMAEDHDRIASLARADEAYDRIEVRVLDSVMPPAGVAARGDPSHRWS